ncbi:PH domain-containing protein [Peptostreptococcus equinus]|uniref:PH domain-containing protein n=1 Tax=Peptostreptococcus equinus TaxID=3003601 RepID=A0ABY7JUP8_9FIRM|nr:PH domain-containing protein [Peptostreptococcus sp. CBA3647]WAW15828.1 PH domain-containing protein [Peptostreptococcus sp. CBA3647]
MRKKKSILAANTTSIDRLVIKTTYNEIVVAPKDKDGFINYLLMKNSNIIVN